jgi:hypothetical protein
MFIHPAIMASVIAILFVAASRVASIRSQPRSKSAGRFTPTLLIVAALVLGSLFWAASWASTPGRSRFTSVTYKRLHHDVGSRLWPAQHGSDGASHVNY